jgi:hypothetical protein
MSMYMPTVNNQKDPNTAVLIPTLYNGPPLMPTTYPTEATTSYYAPTEQVTTAASNSVYSNTSHHYPTNIAPPYQQSQLPTYPSPPISLGNSHVKHPYETQWNDVSALNSAPVPI